MALTLCGVLAAAVGVFALIAALSSALAFRQSPLFRQRRIGKDGQRFVVIKLRTLRDPIGEDGRVLTEAERATTVGSILRRMRLDEFPQLLNVFRGEMALIGPRPLLPEDQPRCPAVRLSVLPGITGWAQVNGGQFVSAEEKAALDEFYIQNACLRLDLAILARTVTTMVFGDRRTLQGDASPA